MILSSKNEINTFEVHTLSDSFYTFLAPEGSKIHVELIDLREYSETYNKKSIIEINISVNNILEIPSGVAFRFSHEDKVISRVEYKNYYDANNKLDEHINFDINNSDLKVDISRNSGLESQL
ncbi:hypothetical protein [Endozoicomonas sp. ALE010]|uniref:hypothetical protein n=1 Tax=Endozoicomonas sp. ALE010 TaxID=3403081 RepID=UPI003BB5DBF5